MSTEQPLRDVAATRDFRIGASLDAGSLRSNPSYWKAAKNEFNAITAENALKMGSLRPSPKTYDFTDADAIVDFGVTHDKYIRGHTLVQWGVDDANSWVCGFDNVSERYTIDPLLFGRKVDPKPAYHAVKSALAGSDRET